MAKHKKKRKPHKNPLLEQKYQEGYIDGVSAGIAKATAFFAHKFEGLEEVEGIGPKTLDKIKRQLGEEYFK